MLDDDILKQLAVEYAEQMDDTLNELEASVVAFSKSVSVSLDLKRNVHSMKGAGASFGIQIVTSVCHQFEDQLTTVKEGQIPDQSLVDDFLIYVDMLRSSRNVVLDAGLSDDQRREAFDKIQRRLGEMSGAGQRKIIVADESRSIRPLVDATFKAVNARVVFVDDGMVALTRCLLDKIDLLVVAGKLKTIDGAGVIAALKLSGRSDIPVCALPTSSGKDKSAINPGPDLIVGRTADALTKLPELLRK